MNETENNSRKKQDDKSIWPQIALTAVAMVTTITGLNKPEYEWLVYFGSIILAIALLVIIWNALLGEVVVRLYASRKNNSILAKYDEEYWGILKKAEVLGLLSYELNRVDWKNNRPSEYFSISNTVMLLESQLDELPSSSRIVSLNLVLTQLIYVFDNWLYQCDIQLDANKATYKSEREMNDIVRLIGKYERFVEGHNELCTIINGKLIGQSLLKIYTHKHNFNWYSSLPKKDSNNVDINISDD